ncbi:hypothetical protein PABG_00645 [Paracoccidioides brasiliensis Pb03]|nr:hypothetical protein PABG_00645 [Paracoccidioides brasiliensis Pb03]
MGIDHAAANKHRKQHPDVPPPSNLQLSTLEMLEHPRILSCTLPITVNTMGEIGCCSPLRDPPLGPIMLYASLRATSHSEFSLLYPVLPGYRGG